MEAKNILIIGTTSGIGRSLAEKLVEQGHNVYSASRSLNSNIDGIINHQTIDATNENEVLVMPDKLDGLVYCPGSINLKPFHRISVQEFTYEWQLNCLGAIKIIQYALPALKKSSQASVVLFSTVAVKTGMPFHSSIAMAKGAIEGLALALAAEYAPQIRVNVIAPSLTDTPLAEKLLSTDEKRAAAAQRHPLKITGTAKQLAASAAFLLSDDASFITGQILGVDGGMSSLKTA